MGSRSFGKGSVQNVITLDNGDAFKLTTSRYYTPNLRAIQAQGIVPDVALAGNAKAPVTERDLSRHIPGEALDTSDAEHGVVLMGETYIGMALDWLKKNKP